MYHGVVDCGADMAPERSVTVRKGMVDAARFGIGFEDHLLRPTGEVERVGAHAPAVLSNLGDIVNRAPGSCARSSWTGIGPPNIPIAIPGEDRRYSSRCVVGLQPASEEIERGQRLGGPLRLTLDGGQDSSHSAVGSDHGRGSLNASCRIRLFTTPTSVTSKTCAMQSKLYPVQASSAVLAAPAPTSPSIHRRRLRFELVQMPMPGFPVTRASSGGEFEQFRYVVSRLAGRLCEQVPGQYVSCVGVGPVQRSVSSGSRLNLLRNVLSSGLSCA